MAARAIRAATVAAAPNEACGLLLGEGSCVTQATVAANRAPEPATAFEIDPAHLIETHRRTRAGGPAVLGCWHSHPNGWPTPSDRDADGAAAVGGLWLIAVPGGGLSLWRWTGHGFQSVALAEMPD